MGKITEEHGPDNSPLHSGVLETGVGGGEGGRQRRRRRRRLIQGWLAGDSRNH